MCVSISLRMLFFELKSGRWKCTCYFISYSISHEIFVKQEGIGINLSGLNHLTFIVTFFLLSVYRTQLCVTQNVLGQPVEIFYRLSLEFSTRFLTQIKAYRLLYTLKELLLNYFVCKWFHSGEHFVFTFLDMVSVEIFCIVCKGHKPWR